MELKNKYIGSFVFIAQLNREVEVCEENKSILIQHNKREFFITNKPKKVVKVEALPKKEEEKEAKKKPTAKKK